jgi:hypothetical protein
VTFRGAGGWTAESFSQSPHRLKPRNPMRPVYPSSHAPDLSTVAPYEGERGECYGDARECQAAPVRTRNSPSNRPRAKVSRDAKRSASTGPRRPKRRFPFRRRPSRRGDRRREPKRVAVPRPFDLSNRAQADILPSLSDAKDARPAILPRMVYVAANILPP